MTYGVPHGHQSFCVLDGGMLASLVQVIEKI
jgi:hypothetical protein